MALWRSRGAPLGLRRSGAVCLRARIARLLPRFGGGRGRVGGLGPRPQRLVQLVARRGRRASRSAALPRRAPGFGVASRASDAAARAAAAADVLSSRRPLALCRLSALDEECAHCGRTAADLGAALVVRWLRLAAEGRRIFFYCGG